MTLKALEQSVENHLRQCYRVFVDLENFCNGFNDINSNLQSIYFQLSDMNRLFDTIAATRDSLEEYQHSIIENPETINKLSELLTQEIDRLQDALNIISQGDYIDFEHKSND